LLLRCIAAFQSFVPIRSIGLRVFAVPFGAAERSLPD
jgi:hypothetical protein